MRLDSDNQTKALLIELRRRRGRFSCVLCLRRWTKLVTLTVSVCPVCSRVCPGFVGVPSACRVSTDTREGLSRGGTQVPERDQSFNSCGLRYAVSKVVSRLYDSDARTLTRPDSRHRVTRRETATRPRQRRRQSTDDARATPFHQHSSRQESED